MTENISVKAEKELKVPETQENRYSFVKETMSTGNMEGLESVAGMVGKIWSENDLNIMDIKNLIPYHIERENPPLQGWDESEQKS